jgi:hypothetical protein
VDALGAEAGSARTLLAMVLCAQGDPSWLTQAQAVIDEGLDPHGAFLMKSLRGDADAQPVQAGTPAAESTAAPDGAPPATAENMTMPPATATATTPNVDRRMVFLRG